MATLNSNTWDLAGEKLRISRLSTLTEGKEHEVCWNEAFDLTVRAIKEERDVNAEFAVEINMLDECTDYKYDLEECLEAYFDHLEKEERWEEVIASCECIYSLFRWEKVMPSEYKFRKGNALQQMGRFEEAESFGKEWLEAYPNDLYAAASNVFLLVSMKKYAEAEALTEKYLGKDLICDRKSDTLFMAAYRLYEMTDNINAKQRVEKKMAEYNQMMQDIK